MSIRRETRKSLRKLPSYAQAVELQLIEKNGGCSFIQCEYSRGYGFRGGMELISVGTRRSHQSNRETLRPMKHITCPLCWKMLSFAERSQLQTEISFECLLILSTRCVDRTIFNWFLTLHDSFGRWKLSVEEHEVIRRVVLALYWFGIYRP
jgi:hypothetical protein